MPDTKRATVYFDPELHRALRLKAAAEDCSVSELVNEAVRRSLTRDAEDLETVDARREEPSLDYEDALRGLRRRGLL